MWMRAAGALLALGLVSAVAQTADAARPPAGRSMWVWYVDRSDGGDIAAIARRAHAAGVRTLIVKSGDGTHYWRQFTPGLVRAFHANGLRVCAWQFVYGTDPRIEAGLGAHAVRNGADCLVADAEEQYEGRYASAQVYVRRLRGVIGAHFPLGLASFPYVDQHPSFPYSVFLGPGGAQYDLPQMYWQYLGGNVDAVFHHTYTVNRIYQRPIIPLGATENGPTADDVLRFRAMTVASHGRSVSWWDYAWTSAAGLWPAIGGPCPPAGAVARPGYPRLGLGDRGDAVVWLQQLLARKIRRQRITGRFAHETQHNLRVFQARRHLQPTGRTGPLTWRALRHVRPVRVGWR
jgi:hypothetical protein